MVNSVAIITPTIGSDHLTQCMRSVQDQDYENLVHHVVIDGADNVDKAYDKYPREWYSASTKRPVNDTVINQNVGANNFYGHRIYAAFSFLVNEDYVCFLDEDNWLEPDHVSTMVENMDKYNLQWTHCLRNIYRKDGTFACQDNCESLGLNLSYYTQRYHIDTSSFMVRRDVLVRMAHAWYGKWGQDRVFFNTLQEHFPHWTGTFNYSLNYRLDGNPGSVTEAFFIEGNKYNEEIYKGNFPWRLKAD